VFSAMGASRCPVARCIGAVFLVSRACPLAKIAPAAAGEALENLRRPPYVAPIAGYANSRVPAMGIKTLEGVSMATMRYQPWAVVSQLQDEINRVFGNLNDQDSSSATAEWVPAVDVREYSDRFELLVDLPGVEPQGVEITLDNGVLTLSGERREEKPSDSGDADTSIQQERRERRQGRFYRRFILPDTADAENVNATGRHGVLEISIKKHAKAQPRRISVK